MMRRSVLNLFRWAAVLAVVLLCPPALQAATNEGPTISLHYGGDTPAPGSPISDFMYFIPLISPVPVASVVSPGNSQLVHMLSCKRTTSGNSFTVTCEMELDGDGRQNSIFDVATKVQRHEKELRDGKTFNHQLKSIEVRGDGAFTVEVTGDMENNVPTAKEVHLHFNAHGQISPIWINLCDIGMTDGRIQPSNEETARVNGLSFSRKPGPPVMVISVASVKSKDAGDSLWQNFKGRVAGLAVNAFIPPLRVEEAGNKAMLDFGQALMNGAGKFTFPKARNLRASVKPFNP